MLIERRYCRAEDVVPRFCVDELVLLDVWDDVDEVEPAWDQLLVVPPFLRTVWLEEL